MALAVDQIRFSLQPVALIKNGDGHISVILISKYDSKFFSCKYGTFELDGNYEYYFRKTPIYFYNFNNSKPISLEAMDEITTYLVLKKLTYLQHTEKIKEIIGANPELKVEDFTFAPKTEFSSLTNVFLNDFETVDEVNNTVQIADLNNKSKAIPKHSMSLMPTISFANLAIIRIGKRQIDIVKGKILGNKMLTKYGVFNIRKETQTRSGKQRIYIFNCFKEDLPEAIKKPLPKKERRQLRKQFNKEKFAEIPESNIYSLGIATERMLPQYIAENPLAKMLEKKIIHKAGVAVHTKLSDPMRKAFPILLAMIGVMGLVVIVANAGTVLDQFASTFELGKYKPKLPNPTPITPPPQQAPQPTPTEQPKAEPPPLFTNPTPKPEPKPTNPNIPSLPIPEIKLPNPTPITPPPPKEHTIILAE